MLAPGIRNRWLAQPFRYHADLENSFAPALSWQRVGKITSMVRDGQGAFRATFRIEVMKTSAFRSLLAGLCAAFLAPGAARASTAYGSINNFDVVNDTGTPCHGFEIEIEDCPSTGITYTYDWNHYGTCKITQDDSLPGHPKCLVRWAAVRKPDGTWSAHTAVPTTPIAPTNGHMFTNPAVNFGGEHFGVGINANATAVKYFWLVDDGTGNLVRGPAVQVSTPTFTYYAPVPAVPAQGIPAAPAQVQAVIEPPEPPEVHAKEFGPPVWVKEIRTTTHNNREVKLRDLVSDDPGDADDPNWRNNEPDEVEVEWEILQAEYNAGDGGPKGKLEAAPEDLDDGDEVVTRRYEFYEYTGPLDEETGEIGTDAVGPDGIHGDGVGNVNGIDYDFSTLEVVGMYLGAQMSAFNPEAEVGLAEHLQNGEVGEAYPDRLVVIPGATPFTCTRSGDLPDGLAFDEESGILSGTPSTAGEFTFTIEASDSGLPAVAKSYTISIAEAGAVLPPTATIDTVADPLDGGITGGNGAFDIGQVATLTATANPGFHFVHWLDNGQVVSNQANYSLTVDVNHSLTAVFSVANPSRTIVTAAVPAAGGSTAGGGVFDDGDPVALTATANAGYHFVNWTEGGVQVSPTATYNFAATADRTLAANFAPDGGNLWTLALDPSPPAGGTVTGAGSYADESEVTIVATPNPGYLFKRWERGNSKVSEEATYTFPLDENLTLNARFARAYEITTSSFPADAGGTAGGGQFEDGDKVIVIASPNPGYVFSNWTEDEAVVSTAASYQFKANPARSLVANFELLIPQPVIGSAPDGGLMLRWPAGLPGWVLEESSDLASGQWIESGRVVEATEGECRVSIVPGQKQRFFRLRHD
jgi:hypothetical protein